MNQLGQNLMGRLVLTLVAALGAFPAGLAASPARAPATDDVTSRGERQ